MKIVLTLYKSFMLKAQTTLAAGHFSNQLGVWGCCNPSNTSKDVQYKSSTSIVSTNKDLQCEQGISSVQMRMCCTNKGHHQVLGKGTPVKAASE